jgi:hypothetical protein
MRSEAACLEREARRVYGRYAREFVERHQFCPWAEKARNDSATVVKVCVSPEPTMEELVALYREVAEDMSKAIGLILLPQLSVSFQSFHGLVAQFRDAVVGAYGRGAEPMYMAPFHPDGGCDVSTPGRLTSFVRRTPDPTVQLVRSSTLNEVRRNDPRGTDFIDVEKVDLSALLDAASTKPIHERILEANRATVERVGVEVLDGVLREIRSDRDASYAGLALD